MATVFLSHRFADEAVARQLAVELCSRGHAVWLDTWEIRIGDSIVGKMNEGLISSAFLVLCYSETGAMSSWMSREWMSTLARQLEGNDVKLLPIRLTGGSPPAILADLKYADLVADWNRGIDDLCVALG